LNEPLENLDSFYKDLLKDKTLDSEEILKLVELNQEVYQIKSSKNSRKIKNSNL
jgi:hypothetical protein